MAVTTTVLSYTGMGEFDSAMRRWSPSSFSVYSFDPEALDPRRMYTFFLQGLSAISRSEFSITEAAEYDADGEEAHMIRFQKNGGHMNTSRKAEETGSICAFSIH